MGIFAKLFQSTDLVKGMADRLGSNLSDALLRDPENQAPKFRSMVMRCSSCTDQAACADLQARCDHLEEAPDYCRNKYTLERAKAG